MVRLHKFWAAWLGLTVVLLGISITAQDIVLKEIGVERIRQEYFSVSFNRQMLTIHFPAGSGFADVVVQRKELTIADSVVAVAGRTLFDSTGLHVADTVLPYDRIVDLESSDSGGTATLRFLTSAAAADRTASMRRGNRITFSEPLTVPRGEFVRGMVLSITGPVRVEGEVNKDAVSLFDNVFVEPSATVRGDVASVAGQVVVARQASVYGATYEGTGDRLGQEHRMYRLQDVFSWSPYFYYNRVDGANPNVSFRLKDPDSLWPTAEASVGYAFASERWRLEAGLSQFISRKYGLEIGAQYYRTLLSDDDWLLSDRENTAFALLVTEDFKDYYEAIGATGFLQVRPSDRFSARLGYSNEQTNWLRAHRHLWSLFGDKRFPENFTTVPEEMRRQGIPDIDTGRIASLSGTATYDSRLGDPFAGSAWAFTLSGELSHPDIDSDYDFKRFTFTARRYQKITTLSTLALRGMIGGSSGVLPIHRLFYLGGLGTLNGYRHKEFLGSRFWMANAEYRHDIPRTDFAVSVIYDAAQIGWYRDAIEDLEIRQSVGGALYLGDDVRISVAKRLDSAPGQETRIYVRLEHVF